MSRSPTISVRHLSGEEYDVQVVSSVVTHHRVTLKESDRQRLGPKETSRERLIEESFRFLLERESNSSILRAFDLPVISRYFPEFDQEIRDRLEKA